MKHKLTQALLLAGLALLCACSAPKDVLYFQDLRAGDAYRFETTKDITVRPMDKLSIVVNSRDPQLTALFNLPEVRKQISAVGNNATLNNSQNTLGYTVDSEGYIDFPVLGRLLVTGMTREQITAYIKKELITKNLVKDPVVTVEFANLGVTVLGEVKTPGRYLLDRDQTTLLDVLGMAGDLTIYGNRNKVIVLRQEGDTRRTYSIDLTSSQQVYSSPAYYMQQNDIVYVEPNEMRARQSTVNGNNVRSTSFWFSLASLLTSLTTIFIVK